jgi:hypothetical protein
MSYRNGKLPFTGSVIADVLIGMVAAYALAAVVLTLFGRPLARYAPGVLTYFSFQDGTSSGTLGWNYTFYDGRVGPFRIGQDETETRDAMIKCGCFRVNPRKPQNPGMMAYEVNAKAIDELLSSGPLLVSRFEAGSYVSYILSFNDRKLSKVQAFSYLLGDL